MPLASRTGTRAFRDRFVAPATAILTPSNANRAPALAIIVRRRPSVATMELAASMANVPAPKCIATIIMQISRPILVTVVAKIMIRSGAVVTLKALIVIRLVPANTFVLRVIVRTAPQF